MTSSPRRLCKCRPRAGSGGGSPSPAFLRNLCWGLLLTLARVSPTPPCPHPRELREKIQPEILELIKQQRLNRLCEGSSFRKIGNRRRQGGGPGALGWSLLPRVTAWGGSLPGGPWGSRQGTGHPSPFGCPGLPQNHPRSPAMLPIVPERFWYCRLALNHKVLHYGDLDDNPQGEVTFESLQEKSRFISLLLCPGSWT